MSSALLRTSRADAYADGQRPLMNRRVLISGWYGLDNSGDEAILQQFIRELVDKDGVDLSVLSERPRRVEECYGHRGVRGLLHHSFLGMNLLRTLWTGECWSAVERVRDADLFVLGGGGIIRDNTNWRNLIRLLDEVWMAKSVGTPVALYAVGAGPFVTRWGRWIFGATLRKCDLITVREDSSGVLLQSIGVPRERIVVAADPALLLDAEPVKEPTLRDRLVSAATQERVVGLFLEEDYTPVAGVARALDRLHVQHGFRFIGIPMRVHDGPDDRQMGHTVRSVMTHPEALQLVETGLTAPEIKWLTARFRFNVTVRLHASIFSISMKTPSIAVRHDPKIASFLRSFDLDDLGVDPSDGLERDLVDKVLACEANRATYADRIERRLPEQLNAAARTFAHLRRLLSESSQRSEG
jgi:polysaccharide pyruvyl transferase CsaB